MKVCLLEQALLEEDAGQYVDRGQCARMIRTQGLLPALKGTMRQTLGFFKFFLVVQQGGEAVNGGQGAGVNDPQGHLASHQSSTEEGLRLIKFAQRMKDVGQVVD